MQVAIYSRNFSPQDQADVQLLIHTLHQHGMQLWIYAPCYRQMQDSIQWPQKPVLFNTAQDLDENISCMISLGGDGTLLDTLCFVRNKSIPVMGVNMGRLGFLANIGRDMMGRMADALLSHDYVIEKRILLHLDASIPLFGEVPYALNDFTLHKKDASSMIRIHAFLNGEFLNTYWADGLIVATPTGSTAYSLSCGGPILLPEAGGFVVTPVAPHNLNVRPLVVPDDAVISFEIEGRSEQFLCTLDARMETITSDVRMAIRKEDFTLNLIRLQETNFLQTLRNKLFWGIDKRN
ncbi:MAG: NAD kinase [Thermoflavifilum sp.]|nr:NAD kinase [Thermoflavifilum sp.]